MKPDISKFKPCDDLRDYYATCNSFEQAWNECPRGDWMLLMATKLGVDIRTLTLAKGLCANTVRHLMGDERSIKAVDAAINFGKGLISEEELKEFAEAAWAARAAADAAWAAAWAARDAAWAAADAAWAAWAAADAADTDAASDAEKENELQTADICREILTEEVMRLIKTI